MNYDLTNSWQKLSDIMGSNYAVNIKYRIHSNVDGLQILAYALTNTVTTGAKIPAYADIYVEPGNDIYLKIISKRTEAYTYEDALYITEVA